MTETFTGTVVRVNAKGTGFKLNSDDAAWINYSKGGADWQGYVGPAFQQGQQVEVECKQSGDAWWASKGKILATAPGSAAEPVAAPTPSPAPTPAGPAPGPAPDNTYQATHDAAEARQDGAEPRAQEHTVDDGPKPGNYAYRDLSIQRQNRLNVAVTALVANLEHCPPQDKANRMITPWSIAEFERMLVEGAVYDDGTGPDYQPPPEDLPGGS